MKKPCVWGMITCASALLFAGCHSAATRIYEVEVSAPGTRLSSYQAPALRVDSLSVPAGWDRVEILRPTLAGEVEISDFDHWSAPLGQAARQALSADLSERLPVGSVIFPRLPKSNGALSVNVDILEFSIVGSRASMQVGWVITPDEAAAIAESGVSGPPTPKRSEALLQDTISSTGPAAIAHAWSSLIAQLADHIAADAAQFK
jgi:uncharacterized lipoprotein YmbA